MIADVFNSNQKSKNDKRITQETKVVQNDTTGKKVVLLKVDPKRLKALNEGIEIKRVHNK
jgi:hypothetical protein